MRRTVRRVRWPGTLLLMAAGAAFLPAAAQERVPERRAPATASRENLLDLLQQLETLQAEVRQLRNSVDVQGHELEQLKNRQRSLYDDLDKRLREAERRGASGPGVASPGATVLTPGVTPDRVAPAAPAAAARVTTAAQQHEYDAAFGFMKQGLYERAIKAFREFLARHPGSGLADNAQYWIAEGNYVLRNYKLALEEFNKVLGYADSTKAPDAMLKIGYAHYELGAWDQARQALTGVQQRYPGTSAARLATVRLDKMKKEGH